MSDDEDYMSSAFLNVTEDVRPGLTFSRQAKRKHDIEKKRQESNKLHRTKSRKLIEEESRNAGLDNAISSDNKGFAILQKMGYKPGTKLGPQKESSPSNSGGLIEPIRIEVKSGRGGLGREEEIKKRIVESEKKRSRIKVYKEEETKRLTQEFRERMRNKISEKLLMADLRKSQKVCQQLDAENNVTEPMRPWFWYLQEQENDDEEYEDEEEEEEDQILPEEQLAFIFEYLRGKYLYCLWCSIKYDSEEDMEHNCPGTEKNDHDE